MRVNLPGLCFMEAFPISSMDFMYVYAFMYHSIYGWLCTGQICTYIHTHRAREEGAKKSTQSLPPVFLTKPVTLNL